MATDFTIHDLGSDRFRVSGSIPGFGTAHGKKSDQVRKVVQGRAEAEKQKRDLQAQRDVALLKRDGTARGQIVQSTLSRDDLDSAEAAVRLIRVRNDPRSLLQLVEIGLQTNPMKQRPLDASLVDEFLAAKKADGIADVSYSSLGTAVRAFVRDCGPAPTAKMVADWIARPESVDGRKNRRANAGNFLAWCVKGRFFPANFAYEVPRPRRGADEDVTPVVLSPKQCRELIAAARRCGNNVTGYLALSLFAGLRPREIHRLSADKIPGYLKSGEIPVLEKVRRSSGERKSRLVPVEETLRRVRSATWWQELDRCSGRRGVLADASLRRCVIGVRIGLGFFELPESLRTRDFLGPDHHMPQFDQQMKYGEIVRMTRHREIGDFDKLEVYRGENEDGAAPILDDRNPLL